MTSAFRKRETTGAALGRRLNPGGFMQPGFYPQLIA